MSRYRAELERRLRPFLERGLLHHLPTRFQVRQAEVAMLAYVVSSDATDERRYVGRPLGHPLVRQPFILAFVGRDHLDPGCSLDARLESIVTHLMFTYHQGMPVFDLQLLQTHDDGLARCESILRRHLEGRGVAERVRNGVIGAILNDPASYHREFLGPEGYLARAARFEYPTPADEQSNFPPEFFSLVAFLEHAATAYPEHLAEVGRAALPVHLGRLALRRFAG